MKLLRILYINLIFASCTPADYCDEMTKISISSEVAMKNLCKKIENESFENAFKECQKALAKVNKSQRKCEKTGDFRDYDDLRKAVEAQLNFYNQQLVEFFLPAFEDSANFEKLKNYLPDFRKFENYHKEKVRIQTMKFIQKYELIRGE